MKYRHHYHAGAPVMIRRGTTWVHATVASHSQALVVVRVGGRGPAQAVVPRDVRSIATLTGETSR